MPIDNDLVLSTAQSITVDALSTTSVDLGVAQDIGGGKQLYVVIGIVTAADSADAAKTVAFSVVTDSTANLATSATTVLVTAALLGSVLTAGRTPIVIPIPMGIADRYIGVYYDVSATFTAFTVDAYITDVYPSNFGQ